MICLRCGCCCINLDVAIVNPEAILPNGTIDPSIPDPIISKPGGQACPHLTYQGEVAVCKIHSLACYKDSNCERFDQVGRQDDVCILGSYYRHKS